MQLIYLKISADLEHVLLTALQEVRMGAYQKINNRPKNFRQRGGAREGFPLSANNIVALPRFVSAPKRPVSAAKDPAPAWTQDKQQPRKDRTSYYRMVGGKLQRRVDYKRIP